MLHTEIGLIIQGRVGDNERAVVGVYLQQLVYVIEA